MDSSIECVNPARAAKRHVHKNPACSIVLSMNCEGCWQAFLSKRYVSLWITHKDHQKIFSSAPVTLQVTGEDESHPEESNSA